MSKYINADKLKERLVEETEKLMFNDELFARSVNGLNIARDEIDTMPSADVVEVKHGEWIKDIANPKIQILPIMSEVVVGYHCSNCEEMVIDESEIEYSNYCPNCGAMMKERKETE